MASEGVRRAQGTRTRPRGWAFVSLLRVTQSSTLKLVSGPNYFFFLFTATLTLADARDKATMFYFLGPQTALQTAFTLVWKRTVFLPSVQRKKL